MEGRTHVLSTRNGPLHAELLFIAEAPGRLGAEQSGIPLTGDQTGRNFDALLGAAGIDRQSIFITNAVLCNPQNKQGLNASPTSSEISNCSNYLHETIQLLQPRYVVTLGQVALRALHSIETHTLTLAQHTGIPVVWYNRWLIALYHPGPRARIYRSAQLQIEDFQRLGNFIKHNRLNRTIV
jgi:uracil-DNA glycosylase family 4